MTAIPVVEDLDKKVAEAVLASPSSLMVASWHTCDTCHCWAGWIVHLAGEEGYALEREVGPAMAAASIAKASGSPIPMYNTWFCHMPRDKVLAEIRRRAGLPPEEEKRAPIYSR